MITIDYFPVTTDDDARQSYPYAAIAYVEVTDYTLDTYQFQLLHNGTIFIEPAQNPTGRLSGSVMLPVEKLSDITQFLEAQYRLYRKAQDDDRTIFPN